MEVKSLVSIIFLSIDQGEMELTNDIHQTKGYNVDNY